MGPAFVLHLRTALTTTRGKNPKTNRKSHGVIHAQGSVPCPIGTTIAPKRKEKHIAFNSATTSASLVSQKRLNRRRCERNALYETVAKSPATRQKATVIGP